MHIINNCTKFPGIGIHMPYWCSVLYLLLKI